MEFIPSKYQKIVFDFTRAQVCRMTGNIPEYLRLMREIVGVEFVAHKNMGYQVNIETVQHAVVAAVAGSGKTKTGKELIKLIPRNMSVIFVAFNKHIAEALKPELSTNARAMTLNSMGMGAIYSAMRLVGKTPVVDQYKVNNMVQLLLKTDYVELSQDESDKMQPVAVRIVHLLKQTLMPVSKESIEYLMDRYSIDNGVNHDILAQICAKVMLKSKQVMGKNDTNVIDFTDQYWLPIVLNLPVFMNDFVLIDESQDMNACQLALALRACKPSGTVIAIGDPNQAIYGFMGADTESMPRIITQLSAIQLPLSISYRIPLSSGRLAKELVPEIECAEWAIEGTVKNLKMSEIASYARSGDLYICRYNAPLVKPCFDLIKAGIKATIIGKDIGQNLITLINEIKGKTMREFLIHLTEWKKKHVEKCEIQGKSPESVIDKYDTLMILSDDCDNTDCLKRKINTIFSEDISAVRFSSIHKAKGLEADNVGILKISLMPSCYAIADWEFRQERNLKYVALTRAKKILMIID